MALVIPSLGIPFSLGMLYNACSEKIIPGKTLWDAKVLDSAKKVAQQPSSNFEVYSKNTLEEKTQSLNVEASLKLSLMGGMIEIGGAGKYLNDERTSERKARVTLKYSCTSRFEQLTMEQIGSIQYPKVLDNNKATHVVTGITYGTDAFFIFDRSLTESETTKNISGNMEAVIKAIPISGSALLDIKFGDKEETDKFECKFYGDLQLPSNPSNFQEAVNVYRELPKLIKGEYGENDKTIPKTIYLHPLSELDGGHLRIVRSISDDLVSQVEEIMQSFSTMTMHANDLLSNDICSKFVELESQLQNFQRLIKRFKTNFSKDLAAILPKIRGEGAEEVVLAGLIESVHASPFNAKDMDRYIKGKSKETKQLIQYLKNMHKESKIEHLLPSRNGDLGTLTSDLDVKHVVCFAFNVVSDSTAYTDALEDFLATGKKYSKSTSVKEWFDNPAISAELRSKSSKFLDFVRTNSCAEGFRFAVTDTNEETGTSGPAIILYTDGSGEDYEPPGKPGTPSATTVDTNRVNLVWTTAAYSIVSHKIWFQTCQEKEEYSSSKAAAVSSPGKVVEFRCTPTAKTKYCIDNLSPGTKYEFWVQAVSDIKVFSVSSEKCCGNTQEMPHMKSLTLRMEVLKEREKLETLIIRLQVQVKLGLNQMDAIQQEEEALKVQERSTTESEKQRVERLLAEKQQQLHALQFEVYSLIKQVQESKQRLSEIASKPNPLTETDYLKLLIASEEQEKNPGWKERVKQYRVLLKGAEVLKSVSHMEIKNSRDQGMLQSMWSSFKSGVSSSEEYMSK